MVCPPPDAEEIPELPDNPEPELLAEPEEADEPVDVPAEVPEFCDAAALPVELPEPVVLAWDEPGRAYATTPAAARPAAPTVTVTARSRAWPRRRASAAAATGRAGRGGTPLPLPGAC